MFIIVVYILVAIITFYFLLYAAGDDVIYTMAILHSVFWPIFWLLCLVSYMRSFSSLN